MRSEFKIVQRLGLLILAILAGLAADISATFAQSASCSRLIATLRTLERNGDFRRYQSSADDLRQAQRAVQQAESRYVREGCNDDAKAGRQLSRECRQLARRITEGRDEVEDLSGSFDTGSAIAEQREAVLQEIARFGCGTGSNARVLDNDEPRRGNIFEQLFDALSGDGVDFRDDYEYDFGFGGQTVRTVCVRSCDGYYWPVSYSTLPDYAYNDADQCQQQCPGAEVELYTYDNPGQEAEQMVSLSGMPYANLPNAFRYRREFDASCSCKAPINYGSINMAETAGGQSRAVIQFGALNFPLPLRDPRRPAAVVEAAPLQVATYVSVPLPRRRPAAPGETPLPVVVAPVPEAPQTRIVRFGDKAVRIVGPDTPYAPTAPAGT